MTKQSKILLSGVKPTGRPHIGNYFGAMKQFVDMQNDYQVFVMIADLHALTTVQDKNKLKQDTLDLAIDYLAIGLDPTKITLFKQSDVSAHAELAWIFECLVTMPYLMRAHAFKDSEAKNKELTVGTFNYPMLMAADILLYETDIVPVGQDQKQHVEYTRDVAEKFNHIFGDTFKLPEPLIMSEVATIPGLDGQKMSKSYQNTIPLFAEDDEIKKLVATIKTDSKDVAEPKDPDTCNVFALHKLVTDEETLKTLKESYLAGGIGYKESKEILVDSLIKFITPLREARKKWASEPAKVIEIIKQGSEKANGIARAKMNTIKEKTGLDL